MIRLGDRTPAELARAINIITDLLLTEAQNREWCSEYNEFVDSVNEQIGFEVLLPLLPPTKRVHYTLTFDVDANYQPMLGEQLYGYFQTQAGEFVDSLADFAVAIDDGDFGSERLTWEAS
jgi:hypothetical protein